MLFLRKIIGHCVELMGQFVQRSLQTYGLNEQDCGMLVAVSVLRGEWGESACIPNIGHTLCPMGVAKFGNYADNFLMLSRSTDFKTYLCRKKDKSVDENQPAV